MIFLIVTLTVVVKSMLNCVFYNQIMSVERCGVIVIIVFECLSRLEFQLLVG